MDSNWREWRHLEDLPERFEEKGWELGPVKYLHLPPVFAEFGPLRIVFRHRDSATHDSLFEVREMCESDEYKAVLVWGLPTPREAQSLLDEYGGAGTDEPPEASAVEEAARLCEFWGELLPTAVYSEESRRSGV